MQLSKNFSLSEFTYSETAKKLGINNNAPSNIVEKLRILCIECLQPIRDKYGKSITISSGYRCEKLNNAIGGSKTSQHCLGEAADIIAGDKKINKILFDLIINSGVPFDQLIWEKGDKNGPDWVHISYKANPNRRQILYLS